MLYILLDIPVFDDNIFGTISFNVLLEAHDEGVVECVLLVPSTKC